MDDRATPDRKISEPLPEGDAWLTPIQVAQELGRHRETIRRWIRDGSLPARRDANGRTLRVRRSDVLKTLQRKQAEANAPQPTTEQSQIAVPGDRTVLIGDTARG